MRDYAEEHRLAAEGLRQAELAYNRCVADARERLRALRERIGEYRRRLGAAERRIGSERAIRS